MKPSSQRIVDTLSGSDKVQLPGRLQRPAQESPAPKTSEKESPAHKGPVKESPVQKSSAKESQSKEGHSLHREHASLNDCENHLVNETTHEHTSSSHGHVHSEESLRKIVNRLSRVEGHIRGIKTMVQENRPCPDVLVQVAAVRGGLDRVARVILDEHLNECITRAAREGNISEEVDALKAALDRFIS